MFVLQVRLPASRPVKAVRESIDQYCGEADASVVFKGQWQLQQPRLVHPTQHQARTDLMAACNSSSNSSISADHDWCVEMHFQGAWLLWGK
jgi:hypothetical protein